MCPRSVQRHRPLDTPHTLSVSSHDPDTTRSFDSATTHRTCARREVDERSTRGSTGRRRRASRVCPVSIRRHRSLDTSHTLSVRSYDPDTTLPFGRTATHETCAPRGVESNQPRCSTERRRRAADMCPRNVWRHSLVDASHTLSDLSPDPDTTRPFDRTVTHKTCARRGVDELSTARFVWTPAPRRPCVRAQRRRASVARFGSHRLRSGVSDLQFMSRHRLPRLGAGQDLIGATPSATLQP